MPARFSAGGHGLGFDPWHTVEEETEEKAKAVAAVWGMYVLCTPHQPFNSKDDLNKKKFGRSQFREGWDLVWCEPDDHPFF